MSVDKPKSDQFKSDRFKSKTASVQSIALLFGVGLWLNFAADLIAEGFWFEEVGYLQVFWRRLQTQGLLGLLSFSVSMAILWGNLAIARRCCQTKPSPVSSLVSPVSSRLGRLSLRWLLSWALLLSLTAGLLLIHYGQIGIDSLNPQAVSATLPKLDLETLIQIGKKVGSNPGKVGLVLAIAIVLLISPQMGFRAIALFSSLGFALVGSQHWSTLLLCLNSVPFDRNDPLFDRNLSFYVFQLPLWELLEFWLIGLFGFAFISVLLVYLLAGGSLSQGEFLGFSSPQRRHLQVSGGTVLLAVALGYWLDRYRLLYSPMGAVYGAGYTDITVQLPVYTGLSGLVLAIALFLFYRSLFQPGLFQPSVGTDQKMSRRTQQSRKATKTRLKPPVFPAILAMILIVTALPYIVQRLIVQPNELLREQPYLKRSIALTRHAFDLDQVEVQSFEPQNNLTYADLQRNNLTIKNIRLWDTKPLLETNRQLQRFRPYYEFPGADIDRYTLSTTSGETEQQQVLIAARELDYRAVPSEAQTWVNEHLIYTHGYGFTISPVNVAGEGGLPDYLIQGIEHRASSERIRNSIPVGKPRIYYGELANTNVMTSTAVRELDYPSGSENVYNIYDGRGGVEIGRFWQRLLFAKHLRDWRMLFSQDFMPQTRLLFRRNIAQRVQAIAPFLRYDSDPYLVVADLGNGDRSPLPNYLYWIIDAYTTSDRYPYSAPGSNDFNYIRNSVKVVVDAYHGSVSFYVANDQDPIIQSWRQIFPDLLQPLAAMPVPLQAHLRYPQDFYRIQSDQLMVYHMTDPQVFYNREDQWRAPVEIYGSDPQIVQPYYLIMKLPGESNEEFLLFRPFTPDQRTNLIAWLAARSDQSWVQGGGSLDRMLLYRFSKQELVYGPEQLEARINQDPVISQQISLWNRQGSRAVQGNLLVIPIENALLYVEPLYLEAEQNQLPTLVRVIVAYGNRIAMAETLKQALSAVFQQDSDTPAIVRPVGTATPQ
jgi:uncharacterized protein